MADETLRLHTPALTWMRDFLAMSREFAMVGEWPPLAPDADERGFADYLQRLDEMARGVGLLPGYAPQSTWCLVRDDTTVVGYSRLRSQLTLALKDVGGHIGYSIRPSERRKGYGTRILALTLEPARALGLDRVLLTCDTNNIGSARIIEKNGGVLSSSGFSPQTNTHVSRYWIAL